jgi:hypothetical protein
MELLIACTTAELRNALLTWCYSHAYLLVLESEAWSHPRSTCALLLA